MNNVKTNMTFEQFEADWNDAQNQLIAAERGHESSKLTPKRAWNAALESVVQEPALTREQMLAVREKEWKELDRVRSGYVALTNQMTEELARPPRRTRHTSGRRRNHRPDLRRD